MKQIILIFSFSIPFSLFAISIQDALAKKLIKIENIETSTLSSEKTIVLLVQNTQKRHLQLEIPSGTIFQPEDSLLQPIILTNRETFTFAPSEKHSFSLSGFCGNAPKYNPLNGSKYKLNGLVNGALSDIIKFIGQHNIQDTGEIQNAIWAATNQHRAEAISNEAFKQFVARTTGQTLRAIQVIYNQSTHPGEAAIVNNKLIVKGLFRYTSEKDLVANLGLYDENGSLLKNLQTNLRHQKGIHKFGFNFEISNLKHQRYFIRLVSGKATISEMEVNF
jgi:hypothetical protein